MNKLIIIALFILSNSVTTSQQQTETTPKIIKIEEPETFKEFTVKDQDYTLHFALEKTSDQKHAIVIAIELHNDTYYLSPNAKKDFNGTFYMDLGSYKDLGFEGEIKEYPLSVKEINSQLFVEDTIDWLRIKTIYKQSLLVKLVKSQEEFIVYGRLQFTIEPQNTFEEIPFAISYKDGEMVFISPKC